MGLFNPKTNSYHASLMERLNMVSGREHACQWQWGRIASEFQDERNFDFARGAYSPIDKLLEIAMSKDRDPKTRQTIEHKNFKILIYSDVRSLELDPKEDKVYSGVWVRDRSGGDTLIKLKPNGKILVGGVDASDEGFQHDSVDVCARSMQDVILHSVKRVERRHLFGFALQPPRDRRQQVILPLLEHVHLGTAVE